MTIDEIRNSDKVMLTPAEVASAIGTDAQGIRIMAHDNPAALGFPVTITGREGRRVLIPRIPFLNYLTGGQHD